MRQTEAEERMEMEDVLSEARVLESIRPRRKLVPEIKRFHSGQRVLVSAVGELAITLSPPVLGTVRRVRMADNGAFVELDERMGDPQVHPFPADDPNGRGRWALTYPDYCTTPEEKPA